MNAGSWLFDGALRCYTGMELIAMPIPSESHFADSLATSMELCSLPVSAKNEVPRVGIVLRVSS